MVIYTHDSYRKNIINNSKYNNKPQKKYRIWYRIIMISKNELIKDIMKSKNKIITMII